ncbi:MAG: VOC family protein [Pseudomonadota bacterium]
MYRANALAHAVEISYVRYRIPDLERQTAFLEDFGLSVLDGTSNSSSFHARGAGGRPFLYIAERGEPGLIGIGFQVRSRADLEALAGLEGASAIAPVDGPGGGEYVRMIDPNGFEIDAVFGQEMEPIEPLAPRPPINTTGAKDRLGKPVRLEAGPARVRRIGHIVLDVLDFPDSEAWYKTRFGFVTSDEIYAGDEANTIGAFLRCDLGDTPVDHHTVFLIGGRKPSVNHLAFEVDDWDTLMLGHDYLANRDRKQHWGVGKHILGSQVFDYWEDPYGHVVEHYTDGDLFDASMPPKREPVDQLLGVQWGQEIPPVTPE